jgi:protoporphyrinogen oxidase
VSAERWGVIGGGMLGMTLALWLRDQGHEVTIVEAAPELGGLAAPWTIGGVVWDRHYHVILNSDSHLLALLERLGLSDELRWVETKTGVYANGTLHSVSNAIEYLRYPELRLIDKIRMGWTILYASRIRDWRSLEAIPVEDWLRRHSGDRAFESFWLPLLRSKLGDNYKQTSAAFIWTTIQRLYAARRSGLKKEMFGYVHGGYERIIGRFAELLEELGVQTRLGRPVRRVAASPQGGVVVDLDGESTRFDRVVVTLAAPLAATILEGLSDTEALTMQTTSYQGIVCASMISDQGLGGFYVTNITDEWFPFTGVIEMTTLVDKSQFGGRHLIYLPRYTAENDPVLRMSDRDIEESFIAALKRMFPEFNRSSVRAFKISRVKHVFPIPTLGYSRSVPPVKTSVPGVFTVNSAQILNGTLNVNETVQLAARVFPRLNEGEGDELGLLEANVAPIFSGAGAR